MGGRRRLRSLRRALKVGALTALLRPLARCPAAWRPALARLFGAVWRRADPRRRRIAEANLAYCFPELTDGERARLLAEHFRSLGFGILEVAMAWRAPPRALRKAVRVSGREHLDAALARGRGAILVSGHFTTLEAGALRISLDAPVDGMYRANRNSTMERALRTGRQRFGARLVARDDVRGLLRRLRANRAVWYAPDQDLGLANGVFAPFFGRPAATVTATSRIAKATGAAVLPFRVERLEGGRDYRAVIEPALEGFAQEDEGAAAARINAIIERWARQRPEQYLWVHRRFKTRPPGEPPLYED